MNNGATFEGKTITLLQDIDLSSICGQDIGNWIPIGNENRPFKGKFNGNSKKIINLYSNTNQDYQGLFGYLDNGQIENIEVQGNITANNISGLVCGLIINNSKINKCVSKGNINSTGEHTGGILGRNEGGTIEYCMNYADVKSTNCSGGIVGIETSDTSLIQYCVNYGKISSNNQPGGICGCANVNSSIKYCYNIGNVSVLIDYGAGGIVGTFGHQIEGIKGTLEGCYNIGDINAFARIAGGISGFAGNVEIIKNIINCGDVYISTTKASQDIGNSNNKYLGRIIGRNYNNVTIQNYKNITKSELQKYTKEQIQSALGDEYTTDVKNEDGTWKYNNGYPILKWQIKND